MQSPEVVIMRAWAEYSLKKYNFAYEAINIGSSSKTGLLL